ncbi:MAG: hypothetical protein LBC28_01390 [Oscillospiraceae bacterium]|jgi:hypothetical protein|nr:hypothetical protein [Oscillospiraceae bacterium]
MKRTQTTKRTLSLLLALVLTFSLAFTLSACAPNDVGGDTTPTPVSKVPEASPVETTPDAATPEETTPDEKTPGETTPDVAPPDASAARGAIQTGVWDGDTFTNEWLNISFTLPDGWTAHAEDEFRERMKLELAATGGDVSRVETTDTRITRDFSLILNSFTVIGSTYLNYSDDPQVSHYGAERYLSALTSDLSSKGAEVGEAEEVKLAGETYVSATALLGTGSANMHLRLYVRKLDDAFVMLTATYTDRSEAAVNDFFASIVPAK